MPCRVRFQRNAITIAKRGWIDDLDVAARRLCADAQTTTPRYFRSPENAVRKT